MRVLHVVEAIEGGIARHLSDLVRHVDAEHVIAMPSERVGGFTDPAARGTMEQAGAVIRLVPMRRSIVDARNAVAPLRVRRLIRLWKPDIVHGHSSIGGAAARLGAAGTGVATVYTPNGLPRGRPAVTVERTLGRLTDVLVAVSESEAALAAQLGIAPPERIAVVPNGIDLEAAVTPPPLDLRAELGVDPSTPVVGAIARLVPQKAPEVYVRACAQAAATVPEARFVLIGDGPLAELVAAEVAAAGLGPRWWWKRRLAGAATLVAQFDVLVLASRFEGGPYAPLEGMRVGTPVVVTDVVGSRDTVEHGRSGLVVPPDDPKALADAIVELLTNPSQAGRIGEAGRKRVAERFDVRSSAERLAELYREVAAREG